MAKGVLGNDPFLRGAPPRDEKAAAQPAPKPAPKGKPPPLAKPPPPPGLTVKAPAKAAPKAPKPPPGPKQWPTAQQSKPARASVRVLMSDHSPVLETPPSRLKDWEPTAHPGAPELLAQLQARMKEFIPHPNTPELKAVLDQLATPHAHSPEAVLVTPATAHRDSPEAVLLTQPTAHRDSPEAVVLTQPTPHRDSPEAVVMTGATAHRHSPEVVADLADARAVAHPLSPEVVEVRPISERRPLVVEVVEGEEAASTPMGDREISGDARASNPVLALGVAREFLSGGIARPLAGAARGLFQAARTAIGLGGGTELDVWGKDVSLTKNLEPLSDFLYSRYFRVTVEGADHVPAGASLLIANHSGALPLDGPMLYLALQRERADLPEVRWLVEDQVFHAPFVGVLANRLGAVRANPENATRLLEEKRPVAVFPEGIHGLSKPFSERYQLKRFGRGGYVKLAVRLHVPIVPVAIVGAEESMPLLARLPGPFGLPYLPITPPPLPAKWQIRFGPPIDLSDAPDNAEEDLAWVAQTNDRTRTTIEGMLTAMLRARTSVF